MDPCRSGHQRALAAPPVHRPTRAASARSLRQARFGGRSPSQRTFSPPWDFGRRTVSLMTLVRGRACAAAIFMEGSRGNGSPPLSPARLGEEVLAVERKALPLQRVDCPLVAG